MKMIQPRERRIPIMFSEEELAGIDDWRFANRIATRADAVRRLCKIALFVEDSLEDVVDHATDGVKYASDAMFRAFDISNAIRNKETQEKGILFTMDEMHDVLADANSRAIDFSEAMESVHHMILTLYNAIAPLAQAKTLKSGESELEKYINEANEIVARSAAKRKESEENRYIGIISTSKALATWNEYYHSLPEDQKDDAISEKIAELADEEKTDPRAFAEKYEILPFWDKPDWANRDGRSTNARGDR
jgi:hypothetical protein